MADPEASETAGDERWPYHTHCSSLPSVCTTQSDERERERDSGERSVTVSVSDVPPTVPSLTRAARKNMTIQSDRPVFTQPSHVYDVKTTLLRKRKSLK